MPELALLTWLFVQIFAPPVIEGGKPIFAFQLKPMFFKTQQLCIKAVRSGKQYRVWETSAETHGLTVGTIVVISCPPFKYKFVIQ